MIALPSTSDRCSTTTNITMKKVRFSDTSTLHVYGEDHQYAQAKSYSAADRKTLRRNAFREAISITKKIIQHDMDKNSKLPLAARLEACGIATEEATGLEHLIMEDPMAIYNRRKAHTKAILMEQAYLASENKSDIHRLAKLSSLLTKRPASQAKKRAAQAA